MALINDLIFEHFPVGPLQCNCIIIGDKSTNDAIVIDPGDEPEKIMLALNKHKLTLRMILHTHAHIDHIGGTGKLKELTEAKIYLHPLDMHLYDNIEVQAGWVGLQPPVWKPIDNKLTDKERIKLGLIELDVIHTPGHSPGSISFYLVGTEVLKGTPSILITGDTLFQGSIGRTDLWGGSFETLMESIRNRILSFPDETIVYPGHGPSTTIGAERNANPFITDATPFFY